MRLYLDDDSVDTIPVRMLRQAGHDVQIPADVGRSGDDDPVHLTHTIREDRVLLLHNHRDFQNLHILIKQAQGHHPGMFAVRRDNDSRRDMRSNDIVRAIGNLLAAGVPIPDELHILNHWR
jgi:hypothetical protein